jgi:hypothetical protein
MTLTNRERADRCEKAIAAYSDDDTRTNLVDFLADAMHLCHLHGRSFDDALNTARTHFDAETAQRPAAKPAIAVVSIRAGLVEEVRSNHPLHVLVEDWDATEVRPSHDAITPERMLPGEEADLTHFFQPATNQGECP